MVNLRHIGIAVTDMNKSLELYRDIFDLEVTWDRIEEGAFVDRLCNLDNVKVHTVKLKDGNGGMIELLHFLSHPELINYDTLTRIGCTHFAITVEEIDSMYKRLLEFGIKFNYKPQLSVDGNAKVAFCRDQNGVLIEVVEVIK